MGTLLLIYLCAVETDRSRVCIHTISYKLFARFPLHALVHGGLLHQGVLDLPLQELVPAIHCFMCCCQHLHGHLEKLWRYYLNPYKILVLLPPPC